MKVFLSPWLKTSDIKAPMTLTIASVEGVAFKDEEQEGGERKALAIRFKELDQALVAPKPVLKEMVEWWGDESDDWVGKEVVLYADPSVTYKGKKIGGIRAKLPTKKEK